jgi:hypothetical protein
MVVTVRDIWLCVDCLVASVNGDTSGVAYDHERDPFGTKRLRAIGKGLTKLGPHLVPDYDSETEDGIREFSRCGCDCCGSGLAGTFHRFAVLGDLKMAVG